MKDKKKLSSHTKGTLQHIETLLELFLLATVYHIFWKQFYDVELFPHYIDDGKILLSGVYALLVFLFVNNSDGFQFGQLRKADLYVAQWTDMVIVNVLTYLQLCLIAGDMVSPWPMVQLTIADILLTTAVILFYKWLYRLLYKPYNMVMVYGTKRAAVMKLKMDRRRDKYQVNAMISVDKGCEYICSRLGEFDAVVINDVPAKIRNDILKYCYQHSIRAYVVPKITDIILRNSEDISTFDTPMLLVAGQGLTIGQRFLKRTMDIILCLVALLLAAPVMLLIALAIKIEDGGPVFFKQKRVTLNGREFDILKFRSMIVDAEREGFSVPATGHDPRITRIGKLIRTIRFDELPQILNILKGDMSIVGPRPERVEHMEEYGNQVPEFNYRLKVKGGLTGYAQIYGKYNTGAYDKLRLDLMYIEHYSLALDIKLILLTIRILFSRESTEGFEVVAENEEKLEKIMESMDENEKV